MYQSGRAGDEAKKRKFPAKSGRVSITDYYTSSNFFNLIPRVLSHPAPVARERGGERGRGRQVGENPGNKVAIHPQNFTPKSGAKSPQTTPKSAHFTSITISVVVIRRLIIN